MNAKITRTINRIGLQIKKHSPEIMMVAGIAGTVVSAVMACKATTKIDTVLDDARNNIEKMHDAEEKENTHKKACQHRHHDCCLQCKYCRQTEALRCPFSRDIF